MEKLQEAVGGRIKEEESELSMVKVPSPMVLLNSLPAIPPEDPLGKDTIVQRVFEVIEVLVVVFAMDPSAVTIDAFLFQRGRVIEKIEDMIPNWDLNCGLEEMQLAALARCLNTWREYLLDRRFVARTVVVSSHMYCTGNIRDEFGIYLSMLDEFHFQLVYMTTRLRDIVEQMDELIIDGAQYDSSVSDPSESESEEEPWVSSAIDSILRNAMFEG